MLAANWHDAWAPCLIGSDGTVHIDRQLLDRTEFRSPLGENLTSARAELAEDLARKIALALESDF